MKLLASPQSARAVTAMLAAPAHHWTLDESAVQSHVSRATLVRTSAAQSALRHSPSLRNCDWVSRVSALAPRVRPSPRSPQRSATSPRVHSRERSKDGSGFPPENCAACPISQPSEAADVRVWRTCIGLGCHRRGRSRDGQSNDAFALDRADAIAGMASRTRIDPQRGARLRIISARLAEPRERRRYHEENSWRRVQDRLELA